MWWNGTKPISKNHRPNHVGLRWGCGDATPIWRKLRQIPSRCRSSQTLWLSSQLQSFTQASVSDTNNTTKELCFVYFFYLWYFHLTPFITPNWCTFGENTPKCRFFMLWLKDMHLNYALSVGWAQNLYKQTS